MKTWMTPWGSLGLGRHPYDTDPALQAWSAADTVLARWAFQTSTGGSAHWVYNDAFGALSALLIQAGKTVVQISDSCLSQRATLWNIDANNLDNKNLTLVDSLSVPNVTEGEWPTVLFRLPKSHALLEFQLRQLQGVLPTGTVLAAAGMAKDVHTSTLELFERFLGPTETDLAEQKARLIRTTVAQRPETPNPFPSTWPVPGLGVTMVSHASVFSREGLDPGTRLLLQHFPHLRSGPQTIIDLGCGNGILGLAAARRATEAEIYCVDESFMAVWSARESFRVNQMGGRGYFLAGDGLEDFERSSADMVLCNPPFHFQNAQTRDIALRFFDQARYVLKPGGELWVVANRHLGHHRALAERFSSVRTAALDERFIVLRAT